jgi:hypothetical protein
LVVTGTRRLGSFASAALELEGERPAFFGPPPLFAGFGARVTRARGGHGRSGDHKNQPPCVSLAFTSRS